MPRQLAATSQNFDESKTDDFFADSTQMQPFSGADSMYRRIIKTYSKFSRQLNDYIRKYRKLV